MGLDNKRKEPLSIPAFQKNYQIEQSIVRLYSTKHGMMNKHKDKKQ